MAQFMDDREKEMIPIVRRLHAMPELTSKYAAKMLGQTEYQEALEVYLLEAARKNVHLPADIIDSVRKISEELLPKKLRARELVSA